VVVIGSGWVGRLVVCRWVGRLVGGRLVRRPILVGRLSIAGWGFGVSAAV
jgi:hypothetical protein